MAMQDRSVKGIFINLKHFGHESVNQIDKSRLTVIIGIEDLVEEILEIGLDYTKFPEKLVLPSKDNKCGKGWMWCTLESQMTRRNVVQFFRRKNQKSELNRPKTNCCSSILF